MRLLSICLLIILLQYSRYHSTPTFLIVESNHNILYDLYIIYQHVCVRVTNAGVYYIGLGLIDGRYVLEIFFQHCTESFQVDFLYE